MKLNVLLAKTDHLATSFKKSIEDYTGYFKSKQGDFKGEKKTYEPKAGTIDSPGKRENKIVVTTVAEKLKWLEENSTEYIDALFSQEATNANGLAKAKLVIDGKEWGEFSSLELLRLKSLLENGNVEQMYTNIPVRSDSENWTATTQEQYRDREIYEGSLLAGVEKTTEKETYILPDPNIAAIKDGKYTPSLAQKNTVIELGDYTHQKFSGELSHRERAEILKRRSKLLSAVIEALKISNEAEAIPSKINATKIFGYLHYGK